MDEDYDVIIVGGGIAGAGLGAEIARRRRTAVVEAEDVCGYHSTGRSAAFYLESYGGPEVAKLTLASGAFLQSPPVDFSDRGFLRRRGALNLSKDGWPEIPDGIESRRVERAELETLIPGLDPRWTCALFEPGCADIDVAALHAAYLKAFRKAGGTVLTSAKVGRASRAGSAWSVALADGRTLSAPILVNAAGAWGDGIAAAAGVRTLDLSPKRRTMVQLRVGAAGLKDLPLVDDSLGSFYFKGERDDAIWLSPHDEIASGPCDAAPEDTDVATAIARFEEVVDWPVLQVERRWAGLRTFAPDRLPVYGFEPSAEGFFWCVGQGGFGIQTAPAASKMAAAVLLGAPFDPSLARIDPAVFSPARFS
jgi:D-arginine dehydrogenase